MRSFILRKGVSKVYANTSFLMTMVKNDRGQFSVNIKSPGLDQFWVSEYELPIAAQCFNLSITVNFISNFKGRNQASMHNYESRQVLSELVTLVCYLNHYSAIVHTSVFDQAKHAREEIQPKFDLAEIPVLTPPQGFRNYPSISTSKVPPHTAALVSSNNDPSIHKKDFPKLGNTRHLVSFDERVQVIPPSMPFYQSLNNEECWNLMEDRGFYTKVRWARRFYNSEEIDDEKELETSQAIETEQSTATVTHETPLTNEIEPLILFYSPPSKPHAMLPGLMFQPPVSGAGSLTDAMVGNLPSLADTKATTFGKESSVAPPQDMHHPTRVESHGLHVTCCKTQLQAGQSHTLGLGCLVSKCKNISRDMALRGNSHGILFSKAIDARQRDDTRLMEDKELS